MKKILFHHVPMTVDVAIVEHAEALFGRRVCKACDDHELEPGMFEDERYVFYHGHFSQAVIQRFRKTCPDSFVFTFLRHPFTRVLAHYQDLKTLAKVDRELELIGTHPASDGIPRGCDLRFRNKIQRMSLDVFLASSDRSVRDVASNLQARFLTVDDGAACRLERAVVTAMMAYDFVGVRELYGPCLRILEAKCGLAPESLGGLVGQDDDLFEVTADQMEAMEASNAYDLALYHAFYGFLLKAFGDFLPPGALDVAAIARLPLVRPPVRAWRAAHLLL